MLSNLAVQDLHKPLDKIQRLAFYVSEDTEGLLESTTITHLTEIKEHCVGMSQYLTALGSYGEVNLPKVSLKIVLHVSDTGLGFSSDALQLFQQYIEGGAEESFQVLEGKGLA